MSTKAESIEVGTIEVKVVPSMGSPEKATLLVVQPQKSCLPIMFERSARTFWNPQFDCNQLEKYHQKISMQQTLRIFQYALGYVALSCLAWSIYIGLQPRHMNSWIYFLAGLLVLFLVTIFIFLLSCTKIYTQQKLLMSVFVTLILCISSLLYYVFVTSADMSLVGIFIGSVEIITLMYTFIPMPLYFCMIIGITYSIVFETFSAVLTPMCSWYFIVGRLLLHAAIHFLGVHLFVVSQVRQRSTFLKVGQSIKSRRDLNVEKQFKQDMIHSLMPPKVAQEVMSSRDTKGNANDEDGSKKMPMSGMAAMTFRSFHMSKMENVSILFADIVGFTKMSSNKSAEHLVSLLSDLFGRFDDICCKCGCEKISTLGDCYYCVSGCPEPKADHARCCVEMGLSMCVAIKQFDEDHKEEVNMRVGVHTGTVLCGLVGTRRFKFDVWSHDVTIANMMESEGRPGCVHISDHTYKFVENDYDVETGESVPDIRGHKTLIECFDSGTQQYIVQHVAKETTIDTWFILDRKSHVIPFVPDAQLQIPKATLEAQKNEANNLIIDLDENERKTPSSHLLPSTSNSKDLNAHLLPLDASATKQSDNELIECMENCSELQTYLYRPPINRFTLNYTDPVLETKYRRHCLDDIILESEGDGPKTIQTRAMPDITNLFDLTLALVFFLVVAIACFIVLTVGIAFWIILAVALSILLLFLVCAMVESYPNKFCGSRFLKVLNKAFLGWFPRHVIHILVAALPACLVYSAFCCSMGAGDVVDNFPSFSFATDPPVNLSVKTATTADLPHHLPYNLTEMFFCMALIVSLLHFCNFTLLSSWFKFFIVSLIGVVLLILVHISVCTLDTSEGLSPFSESYGGIGESNSTHVSATSRPFPYKNLTRYWSLFSWVNRPPTLAFELILVVMLLLLLIAFINYDVEVGYRLCYYGDVQVAKDKQKILKEKEQADWLLHIIVPEHVADQLKHKRHYCENHKDVGVIFAKISNFDDFYDESYEGGKEYLRVLNELMGDFEELFDLPQYKDVEKIKTIGSCLMAASGLDPKTRKQNKDPDAHLYALIDFAVAIIHKVEAFNRDIFNFNFEMKIGFNAGEVTAGVIGTEKLLYDIWGDTVNISSRMYSTGVHDRIQTTEMYAKRLEPKFDFEYRGQTYVKGKGDMNTYLLVGKKKGATWK